MHIQDKDSCSPPSPYTTKTLIFCVLAPELRQCRHKTISIHGELCESFSFKESILYSHIQRIKHLERLESTFVKHQHHTNTHTHTHRRTVYTYPDPWFAGCMMVRIYPALDVAYDGLFIRTLVGRWNGTLM